MALSPCLHTAPGCWSRLAVVWPRYFPDSALTMEGAGRERRGGRDLYKCRVRTQAAAAPPQLEHYFHFSPTDLGRGERRGEKQLETARCRGGGCAIAGRWGGGVEDVPSSASAPLALCATGFSKVTLLKCLKRPPNQLAISLSFRS